MLNILLLTSAGILAYLLAYFFNYLDKARYNRDLKKFYKSELNRHQAKTVMREAKRLMLNWGYSEEEAEMNAINYCSEITTKVCYTRTILCCEVLNMEKRNKKALNKSEHKDKISKFSISDWQIKINQTLLLIEEAETLKQLDCYEQELKEEGLTSLIKFTQAKRSRLCTG